MMPSSPDRSPPVSLSSYRWVVLAVFFLLTAVVQLQWLTFAPIAREARVVYGVSAWQIDLLSLVFMAVFLLAAPPASYIIDTFGLRLGVGIGALLTGVFAVMKGVAGTDYTAVLTAQIGLAVAQPFVLNATTKMASRWFPLEQRALAVGLAMMAQFLGIVVVMILTPELVSHEEALGEQVQNALLLYGAVAAAAAALCLTLLRDRPPSPPGPEEPRVTVRDGLALIFRHRGMVLLLILFFLGLGMFNAISTCIDQICERKGLSVEQTGLIGGVMLITGIVGAVVLPALSDAMRKRRPLLLVSTVGTLPGLVGLLLFNDNSLVVLSAGVVGFFLLGGGAPIGFQYAAEISFPAPESTSQGLLLLAGQISGILFIIGVNLAGTIAALWFFAVCGVAIVGLTIALDESPVILLAGSQAQASGVDEPNR